MPQNNLARRRFLQALGGLSLGLPASRLLERSAFADTSSPLRLLTVFTPHGTWLPNWRPQGGERDFTLQFPNSILASLEPYKKKLLVIDGLDHRVALESGGTGHGAGAVVPFTGAPNLPNSEDCFGPSIDQFLADKLGNDTPIRSLRLGVGWSNSMCFSTAGKRLPSENRPADAYHLAFAGGTPMGNPAGADAARRAIQRRLGVLGALETEIHALSLRPRLASIERVKLDEHLAALRDIEKRIGSMSSGTNGCQAAQAPAAVANANDPSLIPTTSRAQIDTLVQAFSCDVTRFAALGFHGGGSEAPMPYADVNANIHLDVAHQVSDANPDAVAKLVKVHQWYAGEFAYLLQKLDAIHEGDGTLLDHTLILWSNELGNPAVHDHFNVPFVVAGGTNGKFDMGRYARFNPMGGYDCQSVQPRAAGCSGDNRFAHLDAHNGLLVAICKAFGQDVETFGAPNYKGALPGILA